MIFKTQILLIFIFFSQNFIILGYNSDIDSLIQKVKLTNDNISKCNLLNNIALECLESNPSEAILYADKAFHLSFHLDYKKGLATSYLIQGKANQTLNNFEEALDDFFSSLILQGDLNNENEIAEIYYRLGRICKTIGNYEQALEYCLNSLRIREKQKDSLSIAEIYNTMGSIYKYLGNYDQSLEYYFKCLKIQKTHRKEGVSGYIYNNIGIVYKRLNKQEEALKYYAKSLEIRKKNHDSLRIASSFSNIAEILLMQGKQDSAILYLRKSVEIKKKYGNQRNLINVYYNIADYYYMSENYAKALDYTNKSLSIAQQLKILQSIKKGYEQLKDVYQAQGQFDKALDYQIKYTQMKDSIYNVEKSMSIAHLEILYENELKQAKDDLKDQRNMFINIAIYGVLFFLLVISFFVYKNLKSKLKQSKWKRINLEMEKEMLTTRLETRNRELTKNIIHIAEKNELLLDVKKTLHKLKSNMKTENKSLIQSVINDMKASSNNKIWEEFEIRFINVHKDFYNKLYIDYPEVTQNEKRLAAFLKLNMSSKEISMITKQSVHSITVARTRLRKKLGLSYTDINLGSFLDKY